MAGGDRGPAARAAESLEALNYYVTRTELHEVLAQAWAEVPGAVARDSARAHYAIVAKAWSRADPMFRDRLARAQKWVAGQ